MTIPVWMLLGFALWTVGILLFTVGVYRWSRILTGRVEIRHFRADNANEGQAWYQRAMRAHANCVENLPVFAVIVFALYASGLSTAATNALAVCVLCARVVQSVIHIGLEQTNRVTVFRFLFFFAQIACMLALTVLVVLHAA